jgi:hypothetical protein
MSNSSKIVTQEEHDAAIAAILEESPDVVIVKETPASDVTRTEELLGMQEGTLDNTVLRFKKGTEACLHCGRHFNVLDLMTRALQFHSKEFLTGIMLGDTLYQVKYIDADGAGKAPICADCGKPGTAMGNYYGIRYSWLSD